MCMSFLDWPPIPFLLTPFSQLTRVISFSILFFTTQACLKFAAALAAAQMGSGARTGADGGAMALISCCLQVMAAQSAGGQQQQQQPQQGYGGSNQGYGGSNQGYGGSSQGYGGSSQGYGGSSQGYNQPSGYGSNNTQPPPPVASQPAPIGGFKCAVVSVGFAVLLSLLENQHAISTG